MVDPGRFGYQFIARHHQQWLEWTVFSELVRFAPEGRTGDAAAALQFATLSGVTIVPVAFGFVVTASGSYFAAFAAAGALVLVGAIQFGLSLR